MKNKYLFIVQYQDGVTVPTTVFAKTIDEAQSKVRSVADVVRYKKYSPITSIELDDYGNQCLSNETSEKRG